MEKTLFLDRDGIINIDKGYIHKPEDVEFVDGLEHLLKTATDLGYMLIVVTNQSGVARGRYTEEDVISLHSFISAEILKKGFIIKDFFYCPHHPEITGECSCRKPSAGMLLAAAEKYDIDMHNSVMIGDKRSDMKAGRNAGVKLCVQVASGYEDEKAPEADFLTKDLYQAAEVLRSNS